jgi:predicted amidohydrolase
MKEKVKVGIGQIDILPMEPGQNIEKMAKFCEEASQEGVDLILFPELANTGPIRQRDKEFGRDLFKLSETIPGPTTEALSQIAKKMGLHIVVGLCEKHEKISGMMYNSAVLLLPNSQIGGIHRKVHIPGEEKHYFCEGNEIDIIHTDLGKIGLNICYDLWFPEISRIQILKGAEILCALFNTPFPVCPPGKLEFLSAARALENRAYVVSCNRVGKYGDTAFFGGSAIADPFGTILACAPRDGKTEVLLTGELTFDKLLEERSFQPVFKDRRPELYGKLVEPF